MGSLPRVVAVAAGVVLWLVAGCVGSIDDATVDPYTPGSGSGGGGNVGAMGGAGSGGSISPVDPPKGPPIETPDGRVFAPFSPVAGTLRRLTPSEYVNSVVDLLGVQVPLSEIDVVKASLGYTNIAAAGISISSKAIGGFETLSLDIAHRAVVSGAQRKALLGCDPVSARDACVRSFLETFGRRAWRRPLQGGEIERYTQLVETIAGTSTVWSGLEYALAGLLQSPNFLYRVELGEPDPARAGFLRYSAWELAARLSYFLWDTTPDPALLDAAATGEILTPEGLRTQTARLVASSRVKNSVRRWATEYLGAEDIADLAVVKNKALFPQVTPDLGQSMLEDLQRTFESALYSRHKNMRELLTNHEVFVDGAMAKLYGVAPPKSATGFQLATLPTGGERQGVLGNAAFLAQHAGASRTSPTRRGIFIREKILCLGPVPPPPKNVQDLDENQPAGAKKTLRQVLDQHRTDPACAACHGLMDPLGYMLEKFDAIGVLRMTDNGLPIDASGEIDGQSVTGLREMTDRLKETKSAVSCLGRQLYRFAAGHVETQGEEGVIENALARAASAGYRFEDIVAELIASDAFRYTKAGD